MLITGLICYSAMIIGFSSDNEIKINLTDNPHEVRESIMKLIPAGTDINRAKKVMETNGFRCSFKKDSSFADKDKLYEHIDFLYCDLERGCLTGRRWQVAIVIKNSLVEKILVSTGLTGP